MNSFIKSAAENSHGLPKENLKPDLKRPLPPGVANDIQIALWKKCAAEIHHIHVM